MHALAPVRQRVPWRWGTSLVAHVTLLVVAVLAVERWLGAGGAWLAGLAAAFASVHIGYLAHDLDHGHVTANRRIRRVLGLLCWNLLLGVSHEWWRDKHRRHHVDTHLPGRDPDLYELFGHETGAARALRGPHRWFVAWQAWLFWPVTLFARAWYQVLSVLHAARRGDALEQATLALHHALLWGAALLLFGPGAWVFVLVQLGASGFYMGFAFATNHLGVPHAAQRGQGTLWQAAHTRNVRCGPLGDYLLGGLNLQIEHHVYPWLPRSRLRQARAGVRARCEAAGLPYRESGLWTALVEVHAELSRVARAARGA